MPFERLCFQSLLACWVAFKAVHWHNIVTYSFARAVHAAQGGLVRWPLLICEVHAASAAGPVQSVWGPEVLRQKVRGYERTDLYNQRKLGKPCFPRSGALLITISHGVRKGL